MKNKAQIISDINDFCNKTSKLLDDISEGELTYSEIGEYFYDCLGDDIITVLEKG